MKTFLTICTCAMISAGLYGFIDMAGDVTNGTMIRYDRSEEEEWFDASTAAVHVALLNNAKHTKKVVASAKIETADKKKESAPKVKKESESKVVIKDEPAVSVKEEEIISTEKLTADVMVDSVPKTEIESSFYIDYEEFSRGEPRKHKKSKKSKKD